MDHSVILRKYEKDKRITAITAGKRKKSRYRDAYNKHNYPRSEARNTKL